MPRIADFVLSNNGSKGGAKRAQAKKSEAAY
jgi:hypothetical protein